MSGSAPERTRDYSLFGLRVRSSFALPELFPAEAPGDADITIERGTLQLCATEPGLNSVNGSLVLVIPEVARYEIRDGRTIIVEHAPDVPLENVRLYLLGSVFGALLHQRGLLPLHANAVEIDGAAFAFMSRSGGGKSTLAAWFCQQGLRLLADDICVIQFDGDSQPAVLPGVPRLRLWSRAFGALGWEYDGLSRSYAGDPRYDKYDLPVKAANAVQSAMELGAIYLLEQADEFGIRPLRGVEASDAIYAHTYRGEYLSAAAEPKAHWMSSVRLLRGTPMFRVQRKWDLEELDVQGRHILDHARQVAGEMSKARP